MSLSISVDGASATGKTTLGMSLASNHAAVFLDTGLTFRTAAKLLVSSYVSLRSLATGLWLEDFEHDFAEFDPQSEERVRFRGEDLTDSIWTVEVEEALTRIAPDEQVRSGILRYHKALLRHRPRVVVAGRDVSLTLLPRARLHVVLLASTSIRSTRRLNQYRDLPDRATSISEPSDLDRRVLQAAQVDPQGLVIDTTDVTEWQVLAKVEDRLRNLGGQDG